MSTQEHSTGTGSTGKRALRIIAGLVLLLPASLACLMSLLVPTLNTLNLSLQNASLTQSSSQYIGLMNYTRLFQDPVFSAAQTFTIQWIGVRLLAVAIVPVLLALAVNEFGRAVRIPVRLFFTLPLATFAPVGIALAWIVALNPSIGLFAGAARGSSPALSLASPQTAKGIVLLIDSLYVFGMACGVGLIVYLAALRGSGAGAPVWKKVRLPLIASWGIGLLATLAFSLQSFNLSYVLTRGGPANATTMLSLFQFRQAFQSFRLGYGAAVASLILIALTFLGLIAGLIAVLTGLRLETVPGDKRSALFSGEGKSTWGRPLAIGLLTLTLLIGIAVCSIGVLPLAWNTMNSLKTASEMARSPGTFFPSAPSWNAYLGLFKQLPVSQTLVNTLLPPLSALLLTQLPFAYLGALGIGAVRPLGKWSELLLLLFSPWLFVTAVPLSLVAFQNLRNASLLGTFVALVPPISLSVPMLFILTLFFKGQEAQWHAARAQGQSAAGAFFTRLIVPSLPLAALLACVTLMVNVQDLWWPLIVAVRQDVRPFTVALVGLAGTFATNWPLIAAGTTLYGLLSLAWSWPVLGVLQAYYLERLAMGTRLDTTGEASQLLETRQGVDAEQDRE